MKKSLTLSTLACAAALAQAQSFPTPKPIVEIQPAPASIGAAVPATYFGTAPSTVQKELIGPFQLLKAGTLERVDRQLPDRVPLLVVGAAMRRAGRGVPRLRVGRFGADVGWAADREAATATRSTANSCARRIRRRERRVSRCTPPMRRHLTTHPIRKTP